MIYIYIYKQPESDKNHAVKMARFAFDCLDQTALITTQLASSLGPETADLMLRIGLNSGPTTAGGKLIRLHLHYYLVYNAAYVISYLSNTF